MRVDYDELWYHLLGEDVDDIEQAIYDRFELDLTTVESLFDKLIPLIDVGESPLTGDRYKGFASDGMWLARIPAGK